MTDRDAILKRLRRFRTDAGIAPATPAETPSNPPPSGADLTAFTERLTEAQAEIHVVSRSQWPQWVASKMVDEGWEKLACGARPENLTALRAVLSPDQLVCVDRPLEQFRQVLFQDIPVSLSHATAGIADTGTLVLVTGPEEPRTLSLVPPVHLVLFDPGTLVPDFPALLCSRHWPDTMPSNLLLISGPSKTADIQQTLAYGAHGPKRLLVLILEHEHG